MLPLGFEGREENSAVVHCRYYLQKTSKLTVAISLFPNSPKIGSQNFTVIRVFWKKRRVTCFLTFSYVFQTSNFKEKQIPLCSKRRAAK